MPHSARIDSAVKKIPEFGAPKIDHRSAPLYTGCVDSCKNESSFANLPVSVIWPGEGQQVLARPGKIAPSLEGRPDLGHAQSHPGVSGEGSGWIIDIEAAWGRADVPDADVELHRSRGDVGAWVAAVLCPFLHRQAVGSIQLGV